MARPCRLVRAGRSADAQWSRDGDALVVSPAGAPALAVPLAEVSGLAGDGYTVRLRLPDGEISLERLGGDGPTLLAELWRDWPALRASVLRLAGGERPDEVFAGHLDAPALRGAFRGYFVRGRLIVAPDGGDVFAFFPADFASVAFEEESYSVSLVAWDGGRVVFSRLGGRTSAFAAALLAERETLARQAGEVFARFLPTLAAAGRAGLAARWLPGRLLSFEDLERIAPGFEASFDACWLAALPRAAAGRALMAGLGRGDRRLGFSASPTGADPFLWLLAFRGATWRLELLSHDDYATYLFRGGEELPSLVEGIVRLPEFSREALYLPVEQLTGERGVYAIPARDLPLLRNLRERFSGREIHTPSQAGQGWTGH